MITRRRLLAVVAVTSVPGCSEDDSEPIEASASAPAELPEAAAAAAGFEPAFADERTFETTVTVDLSGDVEITARRDVIATAFRRGYARETDGARFGIVSAPAVEPLEGHDLRRDPFAELETARAVEFATDVSVAEPSVETEGSARLLGEDVTVETFSATADGSEVRIVRASIGDGDDFVTAFALAPEDRGEPELSLFEDVRHEA